MNIFHKNRWRAQISQGIRNDENTAAEDNGLRPLLSEEKKAILGMPGMTGLACPGKKECNHIRNRKVKGSNPPGRLRGLDHALFSSLCVRDPIGIGVLPSADGDLGNRMKRPDT